MTVQKKLSDLIVTNRLAKRLPFLFEDVVPTPLKGPQLLHINKSLTKKLEISDTEFLKNSTLNFLNGNLEFEGISFKSSYYAGHQFGYFVPKLGDGRAINIFEIKNTEEQYFELQLKGAGLTPFSRMGDGKAVLRSSIREYLASAHLNALSIPTTEALALISGDDPVRRETIETAAMVLRVSESFLRFGHFEYLYYHQKFNELKELIDTTIEFYFNQFNQHPNKYHLFFQEVVKRTAKLMANWQSVGFCHGVMNTDNMSILGLTIDYGPFGFIDRFDLDHICNHSDHEGRYSFGNQPPIGKWNLEKLAIALSPFLNENESIKILNTFETIFNVEYQRLLRHKLGLVKVFPNDETLIRNLLKMLADTKLDYTNFFRQLCDFKIDQDIAENLPTSLAEFLRDYNLRLKEENSRDEDRSVLMKNINPKFILRNYLAQICIDDVSQIEKMFMILSDPYKEWEEYEEWSRPAPEKYQFICVSCSS